MNVTKYNVIRTKCGRQTIRVTVISSDSKSQPLAPETLGSVSVSASVLGYNGADRIVGPTYVMQIQ